MTVALRAAPVSTGAVPALQTSKPATALGRLAPERPVAIVALLSFTLDVVVGYWLRLRVHYNIGDSVVRTADAVYVALSRDPHIAAVGFYWPPIHSLVQVPLVILLRPFGQAEMAGSYASALWTAGTVLALAHFARSIGIGRRLSTAIVALYALNPLIVFYGANGMSEAGSFFGMTVSITAFVRFCRSGRSSDMALLALALAFTPMVRIEAIALALLLAAIAGFRWGDRRGSVIRIALIAMPALYVFALWLGVQFVLLRDPLFFLHTSAGGGEHLAATVAKGGGGDASLLGLYLVPEATDRLGVIVWVAKYLWFFGPGLGLVVAVWARQPLRRFREACGILTVGAIFVAIQVYLRMKGQGFNDPRYFTPIAVSAAVGLVWSIGEMTPSVLTGRSNDLTRLASIAGVALALAMLALGGVTATIGESNPKRAHAIGENEFFGRVRGQHYVVPKTNIWMSFHDMDKQLDPLLARGGRVICDVTVAYPAVLYSKHPNHFIIVNDRDFERIVADPTGKFEYIITFQPPDHLGAPPVDAVGGLVRPVSDWVELGSFRAPSPHQDRIYLYAHRGVPGSENPTPGRT